MLPEKMTVIEIAEAGAPEVLRPAERALPAPGPGEVLVAVAAAGVNRPDVMQRKGTYPPPPGASDIPGLEIAGTVVALGEGVQAPREGDAVCALVTGGGYASHCLAAAPLCLPLPEGFDAVRAAALPETFFTVWTNVFGRGRLARGERLLVHGGTSGIGTTAIQLARALREARVFATAGSAEKCRFCEELGAEAGINYKEEDFVARVKELSADQGVDVILDIVGGDYLPRNLKCLAVEGRLVQIALQGGPKVQMNLLPIMLKRLTLTGSTLRPQSVEAKAAIAQGLRREVWPLLAAGRVRPIIHKTFALEQAARAHALMESSAHIGKIVLTVR